MQYSLQIYIWNTWKHLKQHMLATRMYLQHPDLFLQHPDKTFATFIWRRWNIWNIHLKHMCIAITTCATPRSTFATSVWNTWNIHLKQMKHLKHRLATCLKTQHCRRPRPTSWGTAVAQASPSCQRREVDGGIGAGTGLPRCRRKPPLPSLPCRTRWMRALR
jgi:hypothetical protein